MLIRNAVTIVLALLLTACSAKAWGPPDIALDQTACSHCGMLVSERVYAAAFQAPGTEPRVFDDIACMLDALRRETTPPLHVWLQDANGAGWLDADAAIVVASHNMSTPMHGGFFAYADAATAATAAAAYRGEVVGSLPELMTWKGDAR